LKVIILTYAYQLHCIVHVHV